ncbi:hypothetical protein LTR62_006249 [Meristemomyces frigidus]|uniref:Uncharacterized protein n=1 Tax=Meristemomyces frigidus TaxID=1508187 RepID=A0AAN7TDP9_9PEZI|nr:hypothetical protein LTR62_006249 [Meristemomyces frigidus]
MLAAQGGGVGRANWPNGGVITGMGGLFNPAMGVIGQNNASFLTNRHGSAASRGSIGGCPSSGNDSYGHGTNESWIDIARRNGARAAELEHRLRNANIANQVLAAKLQQALARIQALVAQVNQTAAFQVNQAVVAQINLAVDARFTAAGRAMQAMVRGQSTRTEVRLQDPDGNNREESRGGEGPGRGFMRANQRPDEARKSQPVLDVQTARTLPATRALPLTSEVLAAREAQAAREIEAARVVMAAGQTQAARDVHAATELQAATEIQPVLDVEAARNLEAARTLQAVRDIHATRELQAARDVQPARHSQATRVVQPAKRRRRRAEEHQKEDESAKPASKSRRVEEQRGGETQDQQSSVNTAQDATLPPVIVRDFAAPVQGLETDSVYTLIPDVVPTEPPTVFERCDANRDRTGGEENGGAGQ